jgi:hypothetical protein
MKPLLTCLPLLLFPLAAAGQSSAPASVGDCERLKNDLAYNECLASFGPKLGERPAREVDNDPPAAVQGSERRGRKTGRGGREAASFDVISGRGGAGRPTGGSRGQR